jgi:hypothetical protein
LEQHKDLLKNVKQSSARLKESMSKLQSLDDKLAQAENIKQFLKERRQLLAEQLKKFGLAKELTKYNKQAYYYGQQIQEYKTLINQPEKLLQKSIGLLSKLAIFREFISKHSELAALFPQPDAGMLNAGNTIPGLQTRAQVQQQIQTTVAAGGPNARAMVQQNIQSAQGQLQQLKNKINELGGGSLPAGQAGSDSELPEGFKPNNEKVKSFKKRLQLETNFQSSRSTYAYPSTTDLGISLGFRISKKSIVGIGTAFKMGWGKDIRNIKISASGFSLRSFADVKLKGSFFATAGFEYNYQQPVYAINQIAGLKNWTQSGLVGISKIVNIKSKYFKKTKLQLLWDALSYHQRLQSQPVKFRIGYGF